MELEDKTTQRFENFILMVIEEVSNEMNDQARTFKSQELREELKRDETKALIKAIVIKTMMNLQKKPYLQFLFSLHLYQIMKR